MALILQGDEIRTQPLHHPTAHSPPLLGQSIFTEQESAFAELHIEFSRIIYLKHFFILIQFFPGFKIPKSTQTTLLRPEIGHDGK